MTTCKEAPLEKAPLKEMSLLGSDGMNTKSQAVDQAPSKGRLRYPATRLHRLGAVVCAYRGDEFAEPFAVKGGRAP